MCVFRKWARGAGGSLTGWGMNSRSYDMMRNGEARLARLLAREPGLQSVIDVGINGANRSALVSTEAPGVIIQGGEPVHEFAAACRARALPGVTVHEIALSSEPGQFTVWQGGRALNRPWRQAWVTDTAHGRGVDGRCFD